MAEYSNNNQLNLSVYTNIESILNKSLSIYKNDRIESDNLIEYYMNSELSSFLLDLCHIISDEKYSKEIRQMAVYVIKNKILSKNHNYNCIHNWQHKFDITTRHQIKTSIISSLASKNSQVRHAISNLIASIFKTELSQSPEWIEAINNLVHVASDEKNENNLIESSLVTMSYIIEETNDKSEYNFSILNNLVDSTLNCLIKNIKFSVECNNIQRLIICLNVFNRILPYANKKFKNGEEKNIMMNIIFDIVDKIVSTFISHIDYKKDNENNKFMTQLLELSLKSLIQICSYHYYDIQEFSERIFTICSKMICNYHIKDIMFFIERNVLFALEILCVIGDKEIESSKFIDENNCTNSSKKFFQTYSKDLIELLTKNLIYLKHSNDKENDIDITNKFQDFDHNNEINDDNLLSEWTISKASAYLLSLVVRLSDSSSLDKLLIFAENYFHSKDRLLRYSALIALCCCLDTSHKEKISVLLKYNFEDFFKTIADKSYIVSKTSSWLLCKISYSYPFVIEKNMLCRYIPLFIRIIKDGKDNSFFNAKNQSENDYEHFYEEDENISELDSIVIFSKEIRINICTVLLNLIKFYGDANTVKNSNPFSPYSMELLDNMLRTAINESNSTDVKYDSNKISLPFFVMQVCAKVIDYSSEDLQDYLENILNKILEFMEKSTEIIRTDKLRLEFEENICVIIESIFRKIKRKVNYELSIRSFNAIINSFIVRKDVNDSGIFCITSISTNIKQEFIPLLNIFMEYVFYSLTKFDDPNISKSAIMAITSIISYFSKEFIPYVERTLPVLLEILTGDDINQSVKLLAISAIGDICLNIPESISNNIMAIMQILFSASEVAVKITEGDKDIDEDTVEYVHQLKLCLVEAFNSLIFGLSELNNTSYLNFYMPKLLGYLKSFVTSDKKQDIELLNNIICILADLGNIYPLREIRQFIHEEFIDNAIKKIKNQNNKKYMSSINWAENILKG